MRAARRTLASAALLLALAHSAALAQIGNAPTTPAPIPITTGNTYQLLLAPVSQGTSGAANGVTLSIRQSLTIENNNENGDNCRVIPNGLGAITPGTTTTTTMVNINGMKTAAQASFLLLLAAVELWTYPLIAPDGFYVTCTQSGNSVYVDTQ